ncbi:MAG: DUF3604 domain-containing protein [Deltaproteobacteria bacterium]
MRFFILVIFLLALPWPTAATTLEAERPYQVTEERAACTDFDPLRRPFFGDLHVHTAYSFDASAQDTRNRPEDAYRFAQGQRIGIQPYDSHDKAGRYIQLERPLDFAAVTDHAEFLGEIHICRTPGTWSYWHPACILHRWDDQLGFSLMAIRGIVQKKRWGFCGESGLNCLNAAAGVWEDIHKAAEEAYDRSAACSFTSFVGYEWTASVGQGKNLHRNVIFRNDKTPKVPISWIETPSAVDLWDHLQQQCVDGLPGCDVLTIPHNSNLSGGLMLQSARVWEDAVPKGAVDSHEARQRARWEPLFEVIQHKGSSECDNRGSWAADELCGFEKLPYDRFGGKFLASDFPPYITWLVDKDVLAPRQLPTENNFMRWALKEGLRQEAELGANGFRFGVIGSTDTHIAAAGLTEEKGHPGHGGAGMPAGEGLAPGLPDDLEFGPGGLAVIWAEENTRDSLFTAMQRREAYATSGTRPVVRFFAGWDYPEDLCSQPDLVARGYTGGVAMGGQLASPTGPPGQAPRFIVSALQDPGTRTTAGTPLQRIQIIKGWFKNGQTYERVVDVAGGANQASVDLDTCQRRGQGASSLCTVWQDPDFDPDVPSFYYARVLENPSCRWSQYLCLEAGVDCSSDPASIPDGYENCCSPEHQPTQQERAWTSPIWYTP